MKINKIAYLTTAAIMGLALVSCTSTRKTAGGGSGENGSEMANGSNGLMLHTVYFDFDKYNIRGDQRANVDEMANSLKDNPGTKVQIQGNTDDRGSVEYNIALGRKRAESLKNALEAYGVKNKIDVVSYGKERPAVQGNDESAWEQNRRDDVVVVGQ